MSGRLAQLGERHVRNVEVGGSNPLPSTRFKLYLIFFYDINKQNKIEYPANINTIATEKVKLKELGDAKPPILKYCDRGVVEVADRI